MGKNLPAWLTVNIVDSLGIDRDDDALRAKAIRGFTYQFRIVNGRRVDTDLICTRIEHSANILNAADAATYRQGNKHVLRNLLYRVHGGIAPLMGGRNVQKRHFVGTLFVVAHGNLHRITRITDTDKIHALDDAAVIHVQAGNDALRQTHD